jgi:hypothetical protein
MMKQFEEDGFRFRPAYPLDGGSVGRNNRQAEIRACVSVRQRRMSGSEVKERVMPRTDPNRAFGPTLGFPIRPEIFWAWGVGASRKKGI